MYWLLRSCEGTYSLHDETDVTRRGNVCRIKSSRDRICSQLLFRHDNFRLLLKIKKNLEKNIPRVEIEDIKEAQKIRPETINSNHDSNLNTDGDKYDASDPKTSHYRDTRSNGDAAQLFPTIDHPSNPTSDAPQVEMSQTTYCTIFETKNEMRLYREILQQSQRIKDKSRDDKPCNGHVMEIDQTSSCAPNENPEEEQRESNEGGTEISQSESVTSDAETTDVLNLTEEEIAYFEKLDCELYSASDDSDDEDCVNNEEPKNCTVRMENLRDASDISGFLDLSTVTPKNHDESHTLSNTFSIGNDTIVNNIGSDYTLDGIESDKNISLENVLRTNEPMIYDEDDSLDPDYVLPSHTSESEQTDHGAANDIEDIHSQAAKKASSLPSEPKSSTIEADYAGGATDVREMADVSSAGSTKKFFCAFCNKRVSKFARHIEIVHKEEDEVKMFSKLAPKAPERLKLIAKMRDHHALIFNRSDLTKEAGVQVARRPNRKDKKKPSSAFTACPVCLKYLLISNIRHHRCSDDRPANSRGLLAESRKIMGRIHKSSNNLVRSAIFPFLRDDSITAEIRYDELVILYANTLTEKYPTEEDHAMIRQKLRTIGRFLQEVKGINPCIKNLSSLLEPKNYDLCIEGVNRVAGISEDYSIFKSPTTATSIGTLLKKVGSFLETLYIKRQEGDKKKLVKDFLKLVEKGFEIINRRAVETLARRKRLKDTILPSKDDIEKFTIYLEEKRNYAFEKLKRKFSHTHWLELSEMTLLAIQVFNRRRQGEASKIKIEDYRAYKRLDAKTDKDMYNSLSKKCKTIAQTYVRFEIRGKLGRSVGILLRDEIVQSVELILNFREVAGVSAVNPYVFGLKALNDERHKRLSACDLMRKYSKLCGANVPDSLRGTKLRKHIATLCADYNLSDAELVDLANFLGHAEKIHKSHYRQPAAREIVTVSQLLEVASGKVTKNTKVVDPKTTDSTSRRNANSPCSETSVNTSAALTDLDSTVISSEVSGNIRNNDEDENMTRDENSSEQTSLQNLKKQMHKKKRERRIQPNSDSDEENEPEPKKRRQCKRVAWKVNEIEIIKRHFGHYLRNRTYPSKLEIEVVITDNKEVLGERHYKHVKAWISNQYLQLKRT